MAQLVGFGQGVVFAAIAFALMWIAKQISDFVVRDDFDADVEIEEHSNLALGLRRAGLYLGLAIGLLGALAGGSEDFASDVIEMLTEGVAIVVFLFVAQVLTDRLVIHGISNRQALRDGNVAVAVAELGVYIATGLIAYGSFAGEGGGILAGLVFFAVGQLALLALATIYERVTPWSVIECIRDGNAAAGLMLAGMLVAFGFILHASLLGPFTGWVEDLLAFALSAGMGIVLLLLLQWPIDRLFLPGTSLRQEIETDRNAAAVSVAAAVKLALALVISAVLI